MKNLRVIYLLLGISISVFVWGALFLQPITALTRIEPETAVSWQTSLYQQKLNQPLRNHLAETDSVELVRYIVHMAETVDTRQLVQSIDNQESRHVILVEELQQTAAQSQQALLNEMNSLQQVGSIQSYRSLWIINAVAVEGTPASIVQLANRSDVSYVTLDETRPLIAPPGPAEQMELMWQTAALAASGEEPWGIERVQAEHVWQGLGIDGAGVTVGIMDSGVDWQHPNLLPNYRGNSGGGIYDHEGNWYDATVPTMTVPYDALGHGTHVAGTTVGQNGIGVAPGASWIAVNIANEFGLIYDSDAHAGFQWLLAPAGNPALAPDVINGSWSGPGYAETFLPDIQALDAAGIIPVFAAGNNGPEEGTVGSPASLSQTIAVGAHDDTNNVTWFSSRGPSPLHTDYHPQIIAPGARTYSSLPDGEYGYYNGTSMATPHTTGAIALLLSANNTLSRQDVTQILTETAVPVSTTHPNMISGWGRLNTYWATAQVTEHGTLTGIVHENGQPLPGVVVTITTDLGDDLIFTTDENGRYTAYLQNGTYQLKTAPFGFTPVSVSSISLTSGNTTIRNLSLTRMPSGTLNVQVLDVKTNSPVQATIDIIGTPLSLETTSQGILNILLLTGDYDLRVRATGYEIENLPISILQNQTVNRHINLTPTKKVLLVDTGAWYYRSFQPYFADSLINLRYAFDTHVVTNPVYPAFPAQEEINEYDVLVWTAPSDSPGYVGANNVITDFLGQGGNLFISGHNVGAFDGYGFYTQLWWYRDLEGHFLGETPITGPITGALNTLYTNLTFTLNTGDSANNQSYIDVAQPRRNKLSEPIFYANGELPVGLQAGHCKPFRMSYLGFGLEGVPKAANRDEILAQSFAYFDTPRQETGLLWRPKHIDDLAPPGDELVYPVQMQHMGELVTDTYSLRIDDSQWPVSLNTNTMELGPCLSDLVTITIQIPSNLPRDFEHDFAITAVSQNDPSVQVSLPIHHKTPGTILLVDDDRWYDQEDIYRAALTDAGFVFDEWDIGWDNNIQGSPTLSLLNAYQYVVWFTGYDWFAPITAQENKTLSAYLDQGGRLFLSSQDFLYYHHKTPLVQNQLGVIEYQESVTPTQIYRGHTIVPSNLEEPLSLTYGNFQNNSDGLTPSDDTLPFLWHDKAFAAGVANSLSAVGSPQQAGLSRSILFGFPFEKLPESSRAPLMSSIIGWLTDVGDSSFEVDQRNSPSHATRIYTITLRNHPLAKDNLVFMTNTLPISLTLRPATLSGGASYEPSSRQIRWQGNLNNGQEHTISYQATTNSSLPDGVRIDNLLTIGIERSALAFNQTASFWVDTPDLSQSTLTAEQHTEAIMQYVTYTLNIINSGISTNDPVTITFKAPTYLTIEDYTINNSTGELQQNKTGFVWTGQLLPQEKVTITVVAYRQMAVDEPEWLTAVAYLEDSITNPIVLSEQTHLPPLKYYFPIIAQN